MLTDVFLGVLLGLLILAALYLVERIIIHCSNNESYDDWPDDGY